MKTYRAPLAIVLALSLFLGVFVSSPGQASQGSGCLPTVGPVSGLTFTIDANAALAALISTNSGASAPATDCSAAPVAGQLWLNTSAAYNVLQLYDGTSWISLGRVDTTNHLWAPPIGGGTATVASATTADLCSVSPSTVTISGTTTISSFGSSCVVGQVKVLKFSGAATVTYNSTSLVLPGARSITSQAGDAAILVATSSGNWQAIAWQRADGTPISNPGFGPVTTLASATTTDLGSVGSNFIKITGATTITSFGSSASTSSPLYRLLFAGTLQLTYNATSMILPGSVSAPVNAGDTATAMYLGSGNWQVLEFYSTTAPLQSVGVSSSSINFNKLTNNGSTPNTKVDWTFASAVLTNATGKGVFATSPGTVTINLSTTGLNGLDQGTLAASTVYYCYGVSNGTNVGGVCSTVNATNGPLLPTGYPYWVYAGAMITDASTHLYGTVQYGRYTQYGAPPVLLNGTPSSTFTSMSIGAYVPATATQARVYLFGTGGSGSCGVAPNNAYVMSNAPIRYDAGASNMAVIGDLGIETTGLLYAARNATTSCTWDLLGFTDRVNAS